MEEIRSGFVVTVYQVRYVALLEPDLDRTLDVVEDGVSVSQSHVEQGGPREVLDLPRGNPFRGILRQVV